MNLLLTLAMTLALTWPATPSFRRFSTDEGLSQVTVKAITEDRQGRIWMGTGDGLNCFSGHSWYTWRHNEDDPSSLAGDDIINLYTDSKGLIWVFSTSGISLCNPDTGEFKPFDPGPSGVNCCLDLRNVPKDSVFYGGRFLLGTRTGLYEMDEDSENGMRLIWRSPNLINSICATKDYIYFEVPRKGLFRWDGTVVTNYSREPGNGTSNCLVASPDGSLWQGCSNGLWHFDPGTGSSYNYTVQDGLSSNMVRSLQFDSGGNLWVGTANNISVIAPDGSVSVLRHEAGNDESLSSSSIHCIFRDSSDGMWVGTFYGGANYSHPLRKTARKLPLPVDKAGMDAVIRSLACAPDGKIWIGTSRSGTIIHDPVSGQSEYLELPVRGKEEESAVNAIFFDHSDGDVLLGRSISGLKIIGKDHRTVLERDKADWVFCIEEYGDGEYLVGVNRGVLVYDKNRDDLYTLAEADTPSRRVFYANVDSSSVLWVGYNDYLASYSLSRDDDGRLVASEKNRYPGIPVVQDMTDLAGRKWFASTKGLFSIDSKGNVVSLGAKDGWPTNLMRGMETDAKGRLWVSSENGIICYNPETGKSRVWDRQSGLKNLKFNSYAHCTGLDGTLYIGGIAGVYAINPSQEQPNPYAPSPVITDIFVNGNRVSVTGELKLKAVHRIVDFVIDVPDFISGPDAQIEYRMEGVDPDWRVSGPSVKASYTTIPSGTHRFFVRARNSSGLYCAEPRCLLISMRPVWYKSPLFLAVFFLCVVVLVISAFLLQERKSRSMLLAVRDKAREDISKIRAGSLASRPLTAKENEFIVRVLEIVDKNISNESFGVQELAAALEMSRSNLNIRLKPITDLSPLDIIRKMRLEQAFSLLASRKYTIAEVAARTGFNSATYFATFFKKETGKSPTEWISRN